MRLKERSQDSQEKVEADKWGERRGILVFLFLAMLWILLLFSAGMRSWRATRTVAASYVLHAMSSPDTEEDMLGVLWLR